MISRKLTYYPERRSQDDSEIRWFNLKAGELAYDPDTCNFFALKRVSAARVDEWTARAEAAVEGAGAV